MPTSRLLPFGQPDFRARTSALRAWGRDLGFEGPNLDCFTSLSLSFEEACQEPLSSKTSTACSLATEGETSPSYSRRWMNSGMVSRGVCLTAKTSECPNSAEEFSLLPCIETQKVPDKYFLSPNAATGILRRTDRMGRNLPASFRSSLEILARGPSSKT